MTGTTANVDFGSKETLVVDIVDSQHVLAAGLSGPVSLSSDRYRVSWGVAAASASVIATAGGDDTIFFFEAGDLLKDSSAAAGCRATFPIYSDFPERYNADAWALFDAMAGWATGRCEQLAFPGLTPGPPEFDDPSVVEGAVRYVYDALGRLSGMVAADRTAVDFVYDPVGNVTARKVHTQPGIGIVGFAEPVVESGETVVIVGTGFDATPASNVVTVDGVAAQVTAASNSELEIVVPTSAGSGTVSVTTPGGSATSTESLIVESAETVSVSSISADVVDPGDVVTITGTGFDPIPENNKVRFAYVDTGLLAEVTAATPTELTVVVPPVRPNTGAVTVTTPSGSASTTVVVPPPGSTAAGSDYLGAVSFDVATDATPSGTRDMYFTFEAEAKDRVSVLFSNGGGNDWVNLVSPSGATILVNGRIGSTV